MRKWNRRGLQYNMNDLVICTEMKTYFQIMLMLLGVHSKCLVSSIGKARLRKCWPTVVLVNDLSCLGVFDTETSPAE